MGFLGLVPSEFSTGKTRRQGEITKTGNGHARRVLVEAAWNYRFPARISRPLQIRQEGQPKLVREIAWRAQLRLAQRYRHLSARKLLPKDIESRRFGANPAKSGDPPWRATRWLRSPASI